MIDKLSEKVLEWAAERNILLGSTSKDQYIKLVTEVGELGDALCEEDGDKIEDAIGDILVLLTIIASMEKTPLAECFELAYNSIKDRKGVMYNGVFIKESNIMYNDIVRRLVLSEVVNEI